MLEPKIKEGVQILMTISGLYNLGVRRTVIFVFVFLDIAYFYHKSLIMFQTEFTLKVIFLPRRKILISSNTQQIEAFASVLEPFYELTQELIFK